MLNDRTPWKNHAEKLPTVAENFNPYTIFVNENKTLELFL